MRSQESLFFKAPFNGPDMNFMRGPFVGLMGPMVNGMAEAGSKMSDGFASIGTEWMMFLGRRMQEDFAFPKHLAECRNPQDIFDVSAEFTRQAAEEYSKEWSRLAEMGSATMAASMNAWQKSMNAAKTSGSN
jgi:phasin family protein